MTKRFEKAYNALVRSYFEGTLLKGQCTACAVGNIVADAQGGEIIVSIKNNIFGTKAYSSSCSTDNSFWDSLFVSTSRGQSRRHSEKPTLISIDDFTRVRAANDKIAQDLLDLTGYTEEELAKVEWAFENNTKYGPSTAACAEEKEVLEDQYNGLCAVVDVLMELDKEVDENNNYKNKFKEHPKLQLC